MGTLEEVNSIACSEPGKDTQRIPLPVILTVGAAFLLMAASAYAGADTTFDALDAKLTAYASGSAGAVCAGVSLMRNLAKVSWNFESAALMQPVGVGLFASVGTGIVGAIVTALI